MRVAYAISWRVISRWFGDAPDLGYNAILVVGHLGHRSLLVDLWLFGRLVGRAWRLPQEADVVDMMMAMTMLMGSILPSPPPWCGSPPWRVTGRIPHPARGASLPSRATPTD